MGRGGIAGDAPPNPMVAVAHTPGNAQIAAYYAAQPPAVVQSFAAVEPRR